MLLTKQIARNQRKEPKQRNIKNLDIQCSKVHILSGAQVHMHGK